jgi:hypothetical protein
MRLHEAAGFRGRSPVSTSTVRCACQPGLEASGPTSAPTSKMVSRRDHFAGRWSGLHLHHAAVAGAPQPCWPTTASSTKPRLVIGTQDTVTRVLHPLQPQAAKAIHPPTWPWCESAGRRHPGRRRPGVFRCRVLVGGKPGTAQAVTIGQKDKYNGSSWKSTSATMRFTWRLPRQTTPDCAV